MSLVRQDNRKSPSDLPNSGLEVPAGRTYRLNGAIWMILE